VDIGLIAVDMDGTLLNPDKQISPEDAQALRDASAAGIALAICSGRMPEDISGYARQIGVPCWVCGCNGCRVLDAPFGNPVEQHAIAADAALACIDVLVARAMPVNAFVGPGLVVMRPRERSAMQEEWAGELERRGLAFVEFGEAALRAAAGRIQKMLVFEQPGAALLPALAEALRGLPGIAITSSWVDNLEIMPAGFHKGTALAALAGRLGIPRARVMAIGDQINDREMLAWAGCGVAMGNAVPEIRALCRHHTDSNALGGVGKAIRRLALPG
jgi:Cof subfamily protein (haloacid dehalogenase superfamily)